MSDHPENVGLCSFFPFCPSLSLIFPFPLLGWSSAGGSPAIRLVPFLSVMWEFFLPLLRVQVLGFCEEPRGNLDCNRRCINNDELSWISGQWSFWAILPQTSVKISGTEWGWEWAEDQLKVYPGRLTSGLSVCVFRAFSLLHLGLDRQANFKPLHSDLLTTQRWETYHAFWLNLRFS